MGCRPTRQQSLPSRSSSRSSISRLCDFGQTPSSGFRFLLCKMGTIRTPALLGSYDVAQPVQSSGQWPLTLGSSVPGTRIEP